MTQHTTIVIPIYPGVTHLDFTGPHQFFARMPDTTVLVASVGGASVEADGLTFAELADFEEIERCDVLCIPGGSGCTGAMEDVRYLEAAKRLAKSARYVTSVCTGSLILGAAGLLRGRRAACHWAFRDMLPLFEAIPDPARVVRDGNIITGGGVTAGIDFAIVLAAEIHGREVAESIQLALEYAPEPPYDAGRPETAPETVYRSVTSKMAATMPVRRAAIERVAANVMARAV